MGHASADDVTTCVLKAFNALSSREKTPLTTPVGPNGKRQWVPLAGIVAQDLRSNSLRCVAFATGMKCQPQSKLLESQGQILHDSHAEVVAIRAFNRHVLEECHRLATAPNTASELVEHASNDAHSQPFRIKPDIRLIMYCSEAPCGDCSMELIMESQQDSSPWPSKEYLARMASKAGTADGGTYNASEMQGRGHFDQLGIVRRKPARADAPISLSKSCSDKLAMKQCLSLLSSLVALFVEPHNAYLDTLVLPECQRHVAACQRAFGPQGRLRGMSDRTSTYSYRPFTIDTTVLEFEYGRRSEAALAAGPLTACNASIVSATRAEKVINGVLSGRRQDDLRTVSMVSRRGMCELAKDLAEQVDPQLAEALVGGAYADVKQHARLASRRAQKQSARDVLVGWQPNCGDDQWMLASAGTQQAGSC